MILIVTASFNDRITQKLESGAISFLESRNIPYEVVKVPGAVELPLMIQNKILKTPGKYKAAIALGCVIKGGTDHYEMVIKTATEGLMRVSLDQNVPLIQGVLACRDFSQAWDRRNLGSDFAKTAVTMMEQTI